MRTISKNKTATVQKTEVQKARDLIAELNACTPPPPSETEKARALIAAWSKPKGDKR